MFYIQRSNHNPILSPVREHHWEAFATFNWCPVKWRKKIHAVYRAQSLPEPHGGSSLSFSSIGITSSLDGVHFTDRRQLIAPEYEWERFGCEDPRITKIGDTFYIFYTALSLYPFDSRGIKIAVAMSKDLKTITEKHPVTFFNAKAMTLFPEKVNGKLTALLSVHTDEPPSYLAFIQFDSPSDIWSEAHWKKWYVNFIEHSIDLRRKPTDHVEIGAPPILTEFGWLVVYSHIQNYHSGNKVFGIEAVLLGRHDLKHIIGRTKGPILVPEEIYEKYGHVGDIAFPSGALVEGNRLTIYYGAADTTCAKATLRLSDLFEHMLPEKAESYVARFGENPILAPNRHHPWESKATFNPAVIDLGGKIHILYRAMSEDNISTIGYATTKNGYHIDERLNVPIYTPREPFEKPAAPGNSGCEDPRIILIDDILYMCYTAFDGAHAPRVAITSIGTDAFLRKEWNWTQPVLITPEGVDDKDTCIFPERIHGRYLVLHRVNNNICADYVNSLHFKGSEINTCIQILGPRSGMWDSRKVGIASPPLKTSAGWLLFYHGISDDGTYRVGAALLDKKDPTTLLSRTTVPLLEPEKSYEKDGLVSNVVFPCGIVLRRNKIFVYYGGADKVVCLATMDLKKLLLALTPFRSR